MPRAATSVATQTRARPSRIDCSALVRSDWLSSPDSATTGKAAIGEPAGEMLHRFAGVAKDDRVLRIEEKQRVDDGVLTVGRGDHDLLVFDIAVLAAFARGSNAHGVALEAFCELGDLGRHSGRKHQRAALVRRSRQDEFEIVAEA